MSDPRPDDPPAPDDDPVDNPSGARRSADPHGADANQVDPEREFIDPTGA